MAYRARSEGYIRCESLSSLIVLQRELLLKKP